MKEKAAYLKGLIDGLGIDENTKEGKVIKAMSELLSEMAETVDSIDEDVTHAYDQINDLSEDCRRETDEIYFALSQLARKNCELQTRRIAGFRKTDKK